MGARPARWQVAFVMLVATAGLLRTFWVLPSAGVMAASIVTSYLYVAAFLAWGASVRSRLLPTPMRACAVSSAWCMVAWMVVRCLKFSATYFLPALGRLCWYAYYPLMLMLSVLFFAGCAYAALRGNRRLLRVSVTLAGTCALALSAAVMTNDLHQCAFAFAGGIPDEDATYSLGLVYWAIVALIVMLVATGIAWLVKASRESHVGWRLAIPFVILALAFAYLFALTRKISPTLRAMGLEAPFFFAETCCITALLVWEWLIRCRLIPGNDCYGELFAAMDAPALVTDAGLAGVYATTQPLRATHGQLAAALDGPVMIAEGVELHGAPIRAGHVFWTADVTELAHMAKQLEEVAEQLAERNEVIAAENELSERRERIAARARVYANAEAPLAADITAMCEEVARMRKAGAASPDELHALTVRLAFVKRAMNLRLSSNGGSQVAVEDVRASLGEMARCLSRGGVECSAVCVGDGTVDAGDAVAALRTFALVAGGLHGRICALLITADVDAGTLSLVAEPHGDAGGLVDGLSRLGIPATVEDEAVYARIDFGRAGGGA